jgi:hypothetical protein
VGFLCNVPAQTSHKGFSIIIHTKITDKGMPKNAYVSFITLGNLAGTFVLIIKIND